MSKQDNAAPVGGIAISDRQSFALLGGAVLFMLIFFIGPLLLVLWASFNPQSGGHLANYAAIASDDYYWGVLLSTLKLGFWVTLLSLILGYVIAYYMTFHVKSQFWSRILYVVIVLPLFTSSIVRSFGWIIMLGRNGLINESLLFLHLADKPQQLLYSNGGVIVSLTYVLVPFMILTLSSALQNISASLHEAAHDLGASNLVTFFKVTLPLSVPGVIAGSLIVFTLAISAYVTPSVMSGGRQMVMLSLIYDYYMVQFNFSMGAALSIVLLISTLGLISAYMLLFRHYAAGASQGRVT